MTIPPPASRIPPLASRLSHLASRISHPASRIPHLASRLPHLASRLPHPASRLPHLASRLPHLASRLPHLASRIPHPASRLPHLASRLPHLASRLPPPASRISPPASRLPPPASRISPPASRLPPPASRISPPASVPPSLYTRDLLLTFSGDEYADFLAGGGRQLRPRLARALELARLAPDMHVLDIGCGRGEITLHAARRGATVTAMDFSTDCLELTSRTLELASPAERARVELVRADATALPVNDSSVHRVLFLDVAEHLQPWQLRRALEEVRRVLRPDGYAVIHTLPNRWALDIGYPLVRRLLPNLPADPRSAYERRVHVNELDLFRLSGALEEAGLHRRVWLENWTADHAHWGAGRQFADALRDRSYPLLRRRWAGRLADALVRTPLRLVLANDLFAIAWPHGRRPPAAGWPGGWAERLALKTLRVSELV